MSKPDSPAAADDLVASVPTLTPHAAERPVAEAADLPDGCSWDLDDEVTITDPPALSRAQIKAELAAEKAAERTALEAEIDDLYSRELLDRFAVALAGHVYEAMMVFQDAIDPDDFSRKLWQAARAALDGRPQ